MLYRRSLPAIAMLTLTLALFGPVPLPAEQQEPLSAAELDRFIGDWPDFVAWSEAADDEATPERWLRDRGWLAERFFYVTARVSAGLVELESGGRGAQAGGGFEQQRAAIQQSPHLSAEQKEQLIERLDRQRDGTAESEVASTGRQPSAAELALIESRRDKLQQILRIDY